MKQRMKLGIIVILAAFLHCDATEAADFSYTPAGNKAGHSSLSQAPAARQTLRNFYAHLLTESSCINQVESIQVPDNKSLLPCTKALRMQAQAYSPEYDRLLYSSPPPAPDPHYYIFGLRKIII